MVFDQTTLRISLGRRLQGYRENKGLTLDGAVEGGMLQLSRSKLSAVENGNQEISAWELYSLSTVYGFNIGELMESVIQELLSERYSINLNR